MKNMTRQLIRSGMLLSLTLSLGLGLPVMADTSAEYLKSAQRKFKAKQDDAAQVDARKARELAGSPREQVEADLMLAQILARQKQSAEALKVLQGIISSDPSDLISQARARTAAAEILNADRKHAQARQMVEPVLSYQISPDYLNQAQGEFLRAAWGFGNWLTVGDLEALEKEVKAILSQDKEAWPGRNLGVLQQAARLVQSSSFQPQAQAYYNQILAMPDLSAEDRLATYQSLINVHNNQAQFDKAIELLGKVESLEGITANDRLNIYQERVKIALRKGETDQALAHCQEALKLDKIDARKGEVHAQILSIHLKNHERKQATRISHDLLKEAAGKPQFAVVRAILQVIDACIEMQEYEAASSLTDSLAEASLSKAQQIAVLTRQVRIRLAQQDVAGSQKALEQLVMVQGDDGKKFVNELQLAALHGIAGNEKEMNRMLDQALASRAQLPSPEKIRTLWDAAKLFHQTGYVQPTRALIQRADQFGNTAVKSYRVKAVDRAPLDVGSWVASGLMDQPGVADARFYPYSQQDAAALFAVDVRTERPFTDMTSKNGGPGETRLGMVYDAHGWHIFVHSKEPRIEQILARNGQGSSSLEMFFTPGTENEPYYQWITNLTKGNVNNINWNSPYKNFRTLDSNERFFKLQTLPLADGWGTAITISWEAFYDQLLMLDGKEQIWRFSMQRWDPSGSVTWGGRVHETGRWGHIHFEPPSAKLRVSIKRNLLKKAWAQYQEELKQQDFFWAGRRGDSTFHEQVIKPLMVESESLAGLMAQVDQWDDAKVDQMYQQHIASWYEAKYIIQEKRASYLRDRLTMTP